MFWDLDTITLKNDDSVCRLTCVFSAALFFFQFFRKPYMYNVSKPMRFVSRSVHLIEGIVEPNGYVEFMTDSSLILIVMTFWFWTARIYIFALKYWVIVYLMKLIKFCFMYVKYQVPTQHKSTIVGVCENWQIFRF